MRIIISIVILLFSALLGINTYQKYSKNEKKARLLYQFSNALAENNRSKLEGFCSVLTEIIPETSELKKTDEALEYINKEFSSVVGFDDIFPMICGLTTCGSFDIEAKAEALAERSEAAYEKQKELLIKNGKSAIVLFPGIALMMLILLI